MTYIGQVIRWAVTIVVIRLLSPSDYGLMAKAAVFIGLLMMISELGLESVIIQRKNISEYQLTCVFGLIICSNLLLGGFFFLMARPFALFYSDERLIPILRVLSVIFLLLPLYILPRGLLIRDMNFKLKSGADLFGALLAAGLTLLLALRGLGVWALVLGNVATHAVWAVMYNVVKKGFIVPRFSFRGCTQFLSFGGFVTGSRALWYFYSQSDIFIGGKYLTNTLLGIYSVAMQLVTIPIEKIMPIISQVALPAYSIIQGDLSQVRSHFQKSVRMMSFVMFPLFGGLLIVAPNLVNVFLGSKWEETILPFTLLCLIMPFRALSALFGPMLIGLGRPDVNFFNVTIASLIMPACFLIGVRWEIVGICIAWIIGYSIVFTIMSRNTLAIIGLPFKPYFSSFGVPLACSLLMFAGVAICKHYLDEHLAPVLRILTYSLLGLAFYSFSILIVKRDLITETMRLFRKRA